MSTNIFCFISAPMMRPNITNSITQLNNEAIALRNYMNISPKCDEVALLLFGSRLTRFALSNPGPSVIEYFQFTPNLIYRVLDVVCTVSAYTHRYVLYNMYICYAQRMSGHVQTHTYRHTPPQQHVCNLGVRTN